MKNENSFQTVAALLQKNEAELLDSWIAHLKEMGGSAASRVGQNELQTQCENLLSALRAALESDGAAGIQADSFAAVRDLLSDISRTRALQGFSPSETATFILSLKQPLFERLLNIHAKDARMLADGTRKVTQLLDQLALYTTEVYQRSREAIVSRQQEEIAELSTPVVKLWDGILAIPLIGTLDSARAQVVMENLLRSVVEQGAEIAIIDITGVPTVDTLVAQHLLKTIAAARLMGADCVISGIRPQIAQTMVHLGVELNVVSKASLSDALDLALRRTGRHVARHGAGTDARG